MRPSSRLSAPCLAVALCLGLSFGCSASGCGSSEDPAPAPGNGNDNEIDDTPGECALGAFKGTDKLAPSQDPPCGLEPSEVPMLVSIGFDDNESVEGMQWAIDMTKERGVNVTFFNTSSYGEDSAVLEVWKQAREDGHEIGNHTVTHLPEHGGREWDEKKWQPEIEDCSKFLTSNGVVAAEDLIGFRTPYLEYSEGTLANVEKLGFHYDASIEEGYEEGQDGTNAYWPYTLDEKSPGHEVQLSWGADAVVKPIELHPGLWELPVYALFVPADLRGEMKKRQDWFDEAGGQITGFDYNVWAKSEWGGFQMKQDEALATLKHTFDQHYKGNRAPFLFGAHTGEYVDSFDSSTGGTTTAEERRATIEAFLDYVLSKPGVKVVPYADVLRYMRNPKPL
jgi:peptidoglycan/xylan/chitin deacetylase (PgdA/CDA1 family)